MIRALIATGLALVLLGGGLGGYAISSGHDGHDYPEAESYTVANDPMGQVDAALARAADNGKRVLLVMGANWCHDSRALAGWIETDRFKTLIAREYELVFINVGMPQTGDGHNLAIAKRFGIAELPGTPNLLVVTAKGVPVNAASATGWRDASSRSEDAIYNELAMLADKVG